MRKRFRLYTGGWEWDGKVGGRREIGREYGQETLSGIISNTMVNWGWTQLLETEGKATESYTHNSA